jgi:hypothetical protein
MRRRSNWAKVAITLATISPEGVVVSTPRSKITKAQPSRREDSMSPAKSRRDRDSLSNFATTRVSAEWFLTASRDSVRAGRLVSDLPLAPPSS